LRSTEAPLPPWQRELLRRALQRDEALRCLALELAEFSHGELPARLNAPDLRSKLILQIAAEERPDERAFAWRLAGAVSALAILVSLWSLGGGPSARPDGLTASAQRAEEAEALALPSATPTPLPTLSPTVTPIVPAAATPAPSPGP
jgi:hypothetical protein